MSKEKMDKEFDIRVTKGSGPGGQHKNKVETCVTVTHIPTGLKVTCQETRSKNRNLKIAKRKLTEKIKAEENKKIQETKSKRRKELIENAKVIRTYNYNTNTVYDHRTKTKHDLKKFMKGEIDL